MLYWNLNADSKIKKTGDVYSSAMVKLYSKEFKINTQSHNKSLNSKF